MPIVVGISLRTAGKIYFFDPGNNTYHIGERVLVETARGMELGTVKLPPHEVDDSQIVPPLKSIIRRSTAADLTRDSLNREREERAIEVCKRLVEKLKLSMRLIDAQFTLDGSHVLIHFLSENRVDFRELVRELARELHARIELRQVGVRDEAKLLSGYGICGRKLCCSAFLNDFAPVTISMAKEQGLALNPQKISGNCGRLMCCLAFECNHYRTERADLPRVNAMIETPRGLGKVVKLNVLSRQIEVLIPEVDGTIWFSADELSGAQPHRPCCTERTGAPCGACHSPSVAEDVLNFDDGSILEATSTAHPSVSAQAKPVDRPRNEEDATPARSRSRRRRKPAAKQPQQGGDAPARKAQSTAPQPTEATANKPKRQRRRQRPKSESTPSGTPQPPVAVAAGGKGDAPAKPTPSGRYRPRRRRSSSGGSAGEPNA